MAGVGGKGEEREESKEEEKIPTKSYSFIYLENFHRVHFQSSS